MSVGDAGHTPTGTATVAERASEPATRGGPAVVPVGQPQHAGSKRHGWFSAGPGRQVALTATLLVAAQTVLRAWVGYRGYFFLDDFAFTGRAAHYSPTDVHHYLLASYNSHLMPGAFLEVSLLTALWPLNFAAVVTLNLVLQTLVGFTFYRLLRELFGNRQVILVPFAVYLFTPITLPAFVWWAAALNQLPQQLAMITALLCHTRYLRTGRVRAGVLGAVATLGGLLFSEKTLLTVPLIAVFTLLWFADGGPLHRVGTAWRAHRRVWLAYLAVSLPYAAYYALEVPSPGRPLANGNDVVQLLGSSFGHALDPGILGGPWAWHRIGFAGALADPGKLSTYLSTVTVLAVVAASIAWQRRAVYGWLMSAGYTLVNLGLLAVSRATFIGPFIGDEYRYVTDVAVVAVLGAALAMMRPVGEWATPPLLLEHRAWPRRVAATQFVRDVRDVVPKTRRVVLVAVAVTAFVASATISTVRYDRYWSINPARPYVTNLQASLALAPTGVVVYDQEVPNDVAWALLNPYNLLSNLVRPLPNRPRFLESGSSSATLAITDSQGHLRRAGVEGMVAIPGPVLNGCGWLLGPKSVRIPLVNTTFPWSWVLRMAYIASADTTATVHAGATKITVGLHRGFHEIYVPVVGAIDAVDFSALTGAATVCTSDLTIGQPVPLDGTAP